MSIGLCSCGRIKTVQPYHASNCFKWLCERCIAKKGEKPIITPPVATIHSTPQTLLEKLKVKRDAAHPPRGKVPPGTR